ncbi:hypothetical protein NL533_33335, partial [Klebsiella pneumoniae]|nr:hypothetical protein [Klebsiella pneumoniae]
LIWLRGHLETGSALGHDERAAAQAQAQSQSQTQTEARQPEAPPQVAEVRLDDEDDEDDKPAYGGLMMSMTLNPKRGRGR